MVDRDPGTAARPILGVLRIQLLKLSLPRRILADERFRLSNGGERCMRLEEPGLGWSRQRDQRQRVVRVLVLREHLRPLGFVLLVGWGPAFLDVFPEDAYHRRWALRLLGWRCGRSSREPPAPRHKP